MFTVYVESYLPFFVLPVFVRFYFQGVLRVSCLMMIIMRAFLVSHWGRWPTLALRSQNGLSLSYHHPLQTRVRPYFFVIDMRRHLQSIYIYIYPTQNRKQHQQPYESRMKIIYFNQHNLQVHIKKIWMVVSTPLKNISQLGLLFPIYGK